MTLDDAQLARQLDRIARRYPELQDLRSLIPDDLSITPEFHAAYQASPIGYARKSILLRLLTGDAILSDADRCSAASITRLIRWLELEGVSTGLASRESVPKGFSTLVGVERNNIADFTTQAFLLPWWQASHRRPTGVPAYAHVPLDDMAKALAPVALWRVYTPSAASTQRSAMTKRSPRWANWFFQTGLPALDLANALVFLAELLDGDRRGGRVQNELPVPLTDRWGLARLSVPEVTAFADVATMAIDGTLVLPEDDWLGLRAVVDDPEAKAWVLGRAGLALDAHRRRATASPERIAAVSAAESSGLFDTGLLYNVQRLTGIAGTMEQPPLARFRGYYEGMLRERVISDCQPAWSRSGMLGLVDVEHWTGVQTRDLGNILALLVHAGATDVDAAWQTLPAPARIALGAPEYAVSRSPSEPIRPSRAVSAQARVRSGDLPILEELTAKHRRCSLPAIAYVLEPGYADACPQDGEVFVHRAHAATYALPFDATPIGDIPLRWDADPIAEACKSVSTLAKSIVVLRRPATSS